MPKKILIEDVRSFRHGLLILPIIDSILEKYKNASIYCWVNPDVAESLKDDPRITKNLVWFLVRNKKLKYFKRQVLEIKKYNFDVFISLSNLMSTIAIAYLAKIPVRLSSDKNIYTKYLLTRYISYRKKFMHVTEQNALISTLVGVKSTAVKTSLAINVNDDYVVNHYLKKIKSEEQKIILIHISKEMNEIISKHALSELIKKILISNKYSVIISGEKLLDQFSNLSGPNIMNLVDKLTHSQIHSLVKAVDLCVLFCQGIAQSASFSSTPFVYISEDNLFPTFKYGFLDSKHELIELSKSDKIKGLKNKQNYLKEQIYLSIIKLSQTAHLHKKKLLKEVKKELLIKSAEIFLLDFSKNKHAESYDSDYENFLENNISIYKINKVQDFIILLANKVLKKRDPKITILLSQTNDDFFYNICRVFLNKKVFFYEVPLKVFEPKQYLDEFFEASKIVNKV
ncbi:MAG: hypothetical protein CMP39_05940 [Rickettsiales bacterium]|nr:hypothetical protein [Rickettsiales bacterium]|tara:strand:- start:1041 stop:2408 length:1368 start_codon:yes stop_codon:yes gene_type:complete